MDKKAIAAKRKQDSRWKNPKYKDHKKDEKPEKPEKTELKASNRSHNLPAVQCKDTLLLNYDYSAQYAKRGIVSNADRYKELSDDDDDNGQLSAADFQQLLSASSSIGDHFTFSAERSWVQNDDANPSDEGSMAADLFKLNITNLKDGIGRIPFYLRQGLPMELFTDDEITDMIHRTSFFENETKTNQNQLNQNQTNQNLCNILRSTTSQSSRCNKLETKTDKRDVPLKKANEKSSTDDELAELLQLTEIHEHSIIKPISVPTQAPAAAAAAAVVPTSSSSKTTQTKSQPIHPTKGKSSKTENIQDWLDDILNED